MVKVKKRDGRLVEFSESKIISAVSKAMIEEGEYKESIAIEIADEIKAVVECSTKEFMDINEIQDLVEGLLIEHGLKKTSKAYILYRSERDRERDTERYGILSKEFLSKYKHSKSPMTQLGELVYYRTYSRFLEDKNRREYWWETVRRAVEYNCSLIPTTIKEAEELFDNIFNLRQFLSGRTFWVGGTEVATKYPMANYNCSFQVIDDYEAFRDVFYLLMIGSGAGVRVLKSDVIKLPKIRTGIDVKNIAYEPVKKELRLESTSLLFKNDSVEIIIGDSKDGWVQALDFFFRLHYSNEYKYINIIFINYNNVRPKGEKLKTFGGTASGHTALLSMFNNIEKVIKKNSDSREKKLRPIDCLDICNHIGAGVVVGGVRRTSEVILMDSDDKECIDAKSELYKLKDGNWVVNEEIIHRQMSNNSIFYEEKPTREKLHWQINKMRYSGEPAWISAENARKRRPNFHGGNPLTNIGGFKRG